MLEEEGLEAVWARHAVPGRRHPRRRRGLGRSRRAGAEHPDPAARSNAVTTILKGTIDVERLRAGAAELGLTLGVGIGEFEGRAFRIGHMGHLNPPMVLGTLGTIEAVLLAAGAPMGGSGVAAAAATAGRAFAAGG